MSARSECHTCSVSVGKARDFRGVVVGRADEGPFIATGYPTKDAENEAVRRTTMASANRSSRNSGLQKVATIVLDRAKTTVHFVGLNATGQMILRTSTQAQVRTRAPASGTNCRSHTSDYADRLWGEPPVRLFHLSLRRGLFLKLNLPEYLSAEMVPFRRSSRIRLFNWVERQSS